MGAIILGKENDDKKDPLQFLFHFQNNYLANKVKEFETTNKELRDEAEKKKALLEEVEEKDKVLL